MLLVVISCACVCAADDNSTPVGADSDTVGDVASDSSQSSGLDDEEGSTGDEEIDLDVTVDEGDDESVEDNSSDDVNDHVSVSLQKHATGIPVFMLLACLLLPFLRRE